MRESDIMYEGARYWVGRDREHKAYVVYKKQPYHSYSVSDSAYNMDDDGLSIALVRAKYLEDNT